VNTSARKGDAHTGRGRLALDDLFLKFLRQVKSSVPLLFLTAPGCTQGGHEAIAGQGVDLCDVGCCEPTGHSDHCTELIESSAASWAFLQVAFDAPSLVLVQLAVEVLGHTVDEIDAREIVGVGPSRLCHR
jgi:hypothetical protein